MEDELNFAFIGNSHIAYWPLEFYFPKWECVNYGVPGEGLEYMESFNKDVSDCNVVIQFGTNDLYRLNNENMDFYVERYIKAVRAIPARKTYLFCIFPRNDYRDSTAVNRFIARLNTRIKKGVEGDANIVYLDVFDKLLSEGRLNADLTIDDLHLNGAGYRILAHALKELF